MSSFASALGITWTDCALRRDHSQPGKIELGQLEDSDSIVDRLKPCLAYALHIGAVEEISGFFTRGSINSWVACPPQGIRHVNY